MQRLHITIPRVSPRLPIYPIQTKEFPISCIEMTIYDSVGDFRRGFSVAGLYLDGSWEDMAKFFTKKPTPFCMVPPACAYVPNNITNVMRISKKNNSYTLNLEFYGRQPKYEGIWLSEIAARLWTYDPNYLGIFKEDDREALNPYLEEYTSLSFRGLFLTLNKIMAKFWIRGNVLVEDPDNKSFRATIRAENLTTFITNHKCFK